MSQKSRAQLKAYLETNDVPTQAQYADVIDSVPNIVDDNYTLPTFAVGTTTTLAAGEDATVVNSGTSGNAVLDFGIPQGIQGLTGADGACVVSVSFVGNDMVFVLEDASTITLTNAKTDLKGDTGAKIVSGAFVGNDLVFTLDDASTATVTNAKVDLKGATGDDGDAATIAIGTVTTVANTEPATVTNVGTSAAAIFDFDIPKGADGAGSGDISGSGTANELAYFTAEKVIDNLPVATYPSLTEVSYVKGVTSAIQTQIGNKVTSNGAITGATKTKITYDAKGLVTSGADATTADIADSSNKRYVTDAHLVVIGNTSGTNSGDNATNSQYFTASATTTLTNKRINPRLVTAASYTTDTGTSLDVSTCDQFEVTAQAGALKLNNPSGTPLGGQKLIVRIKDNGTARALTYDTQFRAMGNALPSTTVLSKTLYMGFIYNATDTKWDLVAVAQEA